MDKKLIMQILVVAAALLFITSSFRPGGSIDSGDDDILGGENITGKITFNGTIRTYDPFLLVMGNITGSELSQIQGMEGVRDVRLDPQGHFIDTETRDDVYSIAVKLRDMDISAVSVANIAAPTMMKLEFGTQVLNVTSQGVVRVVTEPLLEAGDEVTVTMVGISNNGYLIDYHSQEIQLETLTLQLDAEVLSFNHMIHVYTIPWEERNSVSAGEGDYQKIDTIIFDPPLDVGQVMIKKQFPYILYIDSGSAQVLPDFDNKTQVLSNFQDVSVVFPDSVLTVESDESPELDYDSTTAYSYNLSLSAPEGYEMDDTVITFESDEELGDEAAIEAEALVAGSRIISLGGFSLPS